MLSSYPFNLLPFSLRLTQQAHAIGITLNLINTNPFLTSKLISAYSLFNLPSLSRLLFDSLNTTTATNVFLWNSLFSAYCHNRLFTEPISLLSRMRAHQSPDNYTLAILSKASAELRSLATGSALHSLVIKYGFGSDIILSNSVMVFYFRCDRPGDAHKVFDEMPARSISSWNAVISWYASSDDVTTVFELVQLMRREGMLPDGFTICTLLPLCRDGTRGREIHCYAVRRGLDGDAEVHVGCCLIDMYAAHRRLDMGKRVFDKMMFKNVVAWTAMINACVENGEFVEALDIFQMMQLKDGISPNMVSLVSFLPAIGSLARLVDGKQVHAFSIRAGLGREASLNNALIDMYCKCGKVDSAKRVFDDESWCKDVISWSSMISGYGVHGNGEEAVSLFNRMYSLGVKLDHITCVGILSACGRAGLVAEGFAIYKSLVENHRVVPTVEICSCVVDMLGRAGCLSEALYVIDSMPVEPGPSVWGALFSSSLIHNNHEVQDLAYKALLRLEPENPSIHVSESNLHASTGRWDVVAQVRKKMKERGLRKMPGCSWICLNSEVHSFLVADKYHHSSYLIYAVLDDLLLAMKGSVKNPHFDIFT